MNEWRCEASAVLGDLSSVLQRGNVNSCFSVQIVSESRGFVDSWLTLIFHLFTSSERKKHYLVVLLDMKTHRPKIE